MESWNVDQWNKKKKQKHLTDRQQNESTNYSMNTQWNIKHQ